MARPAGRLGRLGPLRSQFVSAECWGQMPELPPRGPGRGGEGILRLGSVAGTPRRGSWGPQLFEDPSSLPCHSRQNSRPSLVRLLGNPEGMVRDTWLPSFVEPLGGETEARLIWKTSPLTSSPKFPCTPATKLPCAMVWVRLPSPAQGSPAGPVAWCPGGAGCAAGAGASTWRRRRADKYRGGWREGSRGLRLGELV